MNKESYNAASFILYDFLFMRR